MSDLNYLVGKIVNYYYYDDIEEKDYVFKCKVDDCILETYYFEQKNESPSVYLNLNPIGFTQELFDELGGEIFLNVNLDSIRIN